MKLWHIAQWGNKQDGIDGYDTQCIISSNDMLEAVEIAELHMSCLDWKDGKADVIYLIGDDGCADHVTRLVIDVWINPASNRGCYPSWHKDHVANKWIESETIYGKDNVEHTKS